MKGVSKTQIMHARDALARILEEHSRFYPVSRKAEDKISGFLGALFGLGLISALEGKQVRESLAYTEQWTEEKNRPLSSAGTYNLTSFFERDTSDED